MVHFFSSPLCAALLFSTAQVSLADTPLSISELEQTLQTIDAELHSLAQISLNSGVGPIGYRSNTYPSAERPVSIRIDLGAEFQIDEIILVPTLWRDIESGFVSDSFPEAFKVFAGTASDPKGLLVAEFNKDSDASPGIGPLIIPASGTRASWIEIKTSRLSPRAFDKSFILQLAEIMVFQGDQNIALHKPVTPSKSSISLKTWRSENLVDGILPYLMNAANGPQSRALVIHGEGQP